MSSTLIPTCPFCGLRYASEPILALHVREDHPRRNHQGAPAHDDSVTPGPPSTTNEANEMTATQRPSHQRPGRMTPRGMLHTLWYVNDQLVRASKALRSVGPPRPRQQAGEPAAKEADAASSTEAR